MKLFRLKKLKLDRIDLVPAGANPEAEVKFFKAAAPSTSAVERKVLDGNEEESVSEVNMTDETTPESTEEEVNSEEESEESSTEGASESGAESVVSESTSETPAAEVDKSVSQIQKQLDESRAEIASLRKAERRRQFQDEASHYTNLGSVQRIADLLEEADAHFSKSSKDTLIKFLKSANEAVDQGALFSQLSKDGEGTATDWESKLSAAANDAVAKGTHPTIEQAKVAIMESDRTLQQEREAAIRS